MGRGIRRGGGIRKGLRPSKSFRDSRRGSIRRRRSRRLGGGRRGRGAWTAARPAEGQVVIISASASLKPSQSSSEAAGDCEGRRSGQGSGAGPVRNDELATAGLNHLGPEIAEKRRTGGSDGGRSQGRGRIVGILDKQDRGGGGVGEADLIACARKIIIIQ